MYIICISFVYGWLAHISFVNMSSDAIFTSFEAVCREKNHFEKFHWC